MKTLFISILLFAGNFLQSQIQAQVKSKAVSVPVSAAAPVKAAFKANGTYIEGVAVPPRSNYQPTFTGTVFNEGKYFLLSNGGEFVVPAEGIYHFDVRVSWLQFSAAGKVTINLHRSFSDIVATSIQISSTTHLFDSNLSTTVKLKAGDKVNIYIRQDTGVPQKFQQVQFSGFQVN